MEVIETVSSMKSQSAKWFVESKSIGIVPTMGCLHEGHLSLIRKSVEECDVTVVTIFVNPIQFAPGEDFSTYPRVFERDCRLCENEKADVVFHPPEQEIYPAGFQTKVIVENLQNHLCGLSRQGHFDGVSTVVLKLFNIVSPQKAYFGKKDYQQIQILKRMAEDLNLDVTIVGMPIIRENDTLAMSSRNKYLSENERQRALIVPQVIEEAEKCLNQGEKEIPDIISQLCSMVEKTEGAQVDYISIADPLTLNELKEFQTDILVAVAIKIGSARLIDNKVIHITQS